MKYIIVIILTISLVSGCKTKSPAADSNQAAEVAYASNKTDFSKQETWILGYFKRSQITSSLHSEWFTEEYNGYSPAPDAVNKLTTTDMSQVTIKIVLGTWCPDSRREVPRFLKIADIINFPSDKITYIGVDNTKLSPIGEYESLGIERVPTFIIYKNNIEAGRIIETPVSSLEQDMVNILNKE